MFSKEVVFMKPIISSLRRAIIAPMQEILHAVDAVKKRRILHALKKLPPHNPSAAFDFLQFHRFSYQKIGKNQWVLCTTEAHWLAYLPFLERATDQSWSLCLKDDSNEENFRENTIVSSPNRKIEQTLRQAWELHASDIFIIVTPTQATVQFRTHRTLSMPQYEPREQGLALLRSFLTLGYLTFNETIQHQEGHFRYVFDEKTIFGRISYVADFHAQTIAIRILSENLFPFHIDSLQLPNQLLTLLRSNSPRWRSGMILISGPTGSGKTTTLYALGKLFHQQGQKIISLEDPIEAEIHDWVQSEINAQCGYTFEQALLGTLRQDPDVVLIGEIRDPETAKAAFYASLSGYLVITTLHANALHLIPFRCQELGINFGTFRNAVHLQIHQVWSEKNSSNAPIFSWQTAPDLDKEENVPSSSTI